MQAFAQNCGLPVLPGRKPFGGHVLSHDFVEAALMRRGGWKVGMATDCGGSWEESPPSLIDVAVRDRRWAQGNLQHLKVMPLRGLHWLSRVHMLTGVLSYATSPMWLAVLVLSSIITCEEAVEGHQYFQPGAYSLFPNWPEYRDGEITALLAVTIVVLLLPKLLGATLALIDRSLRRGFGGGVRLVLSLFIEQLFSMLLAPAMMAFHSTFVLSTLAGRPVVWNAQERGDRGVTFLDALRRHYWHMLLGLVWGVSILFLAPKFIWWMMPVLAGLLLSAPLTVLSSRASVGRFLRRRGLLLTPEEVTPPRELEAAHAAFQSAPAPALLPPPAGEPPHSQPAPAPLPMEASAPNYLSLRSTLDNLHRRGSAWAAARRLEHGAGR